MSSFIEFWEINLLIEFWKVSFIDRFIFIKCFSFSFLFIYVIIKELFSNDFI